MRKVDILLFLFVGILVGAVSVHLFWQSRFNEEVKRAVEHTVMFNLTHDGKGNVYYRVDK